VLSRFHPWFDDNSDDRGEERCEQPVEHASVIVRFVKDCVVNEVT